MAQVGTKASSLLQSPKVHLSHRVTGLDQHSTFREFLDAGIAGCRSSYPAFLVLSFGSPCFLLKNMPDTS